MEFLSRAAPTVSSPSCLRLSHQHDIWAPNSQTQYPALRMATFAKSSFNAASYAAFRPTYPSRLYDLIYAYHRLGKTGSNFSEKALDLGCGTGQATKELPRFFRQTTGTDPSPGMIEKAKSDPSLIEMGLVNFSVANAEEIAALVPENSVDLVTAAQAAHWFDHDRVWAALARILKPGGTVAFWGYAEFRIVGRPDLTPLVTQYSYGENSLGPYWEQPGRSILDNHFAAIKFPVSSEWNSSSGRRIYFSGDLVPQVQQLPYRSFPDPNGPLPEEQQYRTDPILKKKLTWEGLQSYLRTWSSLHTYHQNHPEDKAKTGGGVDGDIADRYVETLKREIGGEGLEVQWPLTLIMIQKS